MLPLLIPWRQLVTKNLALKINIQKNPDSFVMKEVKWFNCLLSGHACKPISSYSRSVVRAVSDEW